MSTFARRRWRNLIIAVIAAGLVLGVLWALGASLARTELATGWVLLAAMLVLAGYNLRKKLPFLPLLRSSTWLQVHVYVGLITIVLFAGHIGLRVPRGAIEIALAVLYVAVAGTGVLGLVLTRVLPPRLNTRGENIIYERIPVIRADLSRRAEALALDSVQVGSITTISDFYRDRLVSFFAAPRNFWAHLIGSSRARHELLTEINALQRYLADADRSHLDELARLVRLKDDLDFRYASYSALKGWLFLHIPLTYVLLMMVAVHVVLLYAYKGAGT